MTSPAFEYAWVVADQGSTPFGAGYTPPDWFSSPPIGNVLDVPRYAPTVTHDGTGMYHVDLPFVGLSGGGSVQVSAYGDGPQRCKVQYWFPLGDGIVYLNKTRIGVVCHDAVGSSADSPFIVYGEWGGNPYSAGFGGSPDPSGTTNLEGAAYVRSDQLTGSFTPSLSYQWSTSGSPITVSSLGTGNYLVFLPGLSNVGDGGTLVTAFGSDASYCNVGLVLVSGSQTMVDVHCFDTTGAPTNSLFTLSYRYASQQDQTSDWLAYLWANRPSATTEYSPPPSISFNPDFASGDVPPNSVARLDTGLYAVTIPAQMLPNSGVPKPVISGMTLATARGNGPQYCKIGQVSTSERMLGYYSQFTYFVRCFSPSSGVAADSGFDSRVEYGVAGTLATNCPGDPIHCGAPIPVPPELQ